MSQKPLLLGAVAYDPKVITIWDGFQQYFAERGLFDGILCTNCEHQVEAHFAGRRTSPELPHAADRAWSGRWTPRRGDPHARHGSRSHRS